MSNHQKEACIAEFVGPLLKRLKLAKERVPENSELEKIIDQISTEVVKTKDILNSREKLDRELAGYFGKIERQIDPWIDHKPRKKASDLPHKATITKVGESSNTSYQTNEEVFKLEKSLKYYMNEYWESGYLKSLLIFPENTEVKKGFVIYWWMGMYGQFTEGIERFFFELVDNKVLIPVHREHNKVVDRFTIEPILHKWLLYRNVRVSSEKREEGAWRLYREPNEPNFHMLLNLDQRYLNSKDIIDISRKHDDLRVVQLGSWRYTPIKIQKTGTEETKSKDHIEVNQTDFLKKLGKNVRYLSLRGISGITELPYSIGKLEYLKILDLRACHNLEKLPQKPRSMLKQKWVCELPNLEVLKDFVVGNLGNKNQSCQLGDLSKLQWLRKLSIRVATDILSPETFRGFNSINNLQILTITWGGNKYREIPHYFLPKNLEKLDMRCYPEAEASKWLNPQELKNLKRLYIRGGNLIKIPCHNNWKVEILRFRFLKKLVPTDWNEVRSSFNNLKYVEYVECRKPQNFPNKDGSSWRNEAIDDNVLQDQFEKLLKLFG